MSDTKINSIESSISIKIKKSCITYTTNTTNNPKSAKLIFEGFSEDRLNRIFQKYCLSKQSKMVEFLLTLKGHQEIKDPHVINEAFVGACRGGYAKVVNVLLCLNDWRRINDPDIIKQGFDLACENKNIHVIRMLLNLKDDRKIGCSTIKEAFKKAFFKDGDCGHTEITQTLFDTINLM